MDHVVPQEKEESLEAPAAAIESSSLTVETSTVKRFPISLKPKREAYINNNRVSEEGKPNDEEVLRVRPIEQQQRPGRVFRRRKKAFLVAAEDEDSDEEEDSAEDLPIISSTSKYLSPLPEEHSSTDDGGEEETEDHQVESSDYGLYSSNETSDCQDDSAPPTPLHLSDREVDGGENTRKSETRNGSEQTARRDTEYSEVESSGLQSSQSEGDEEITLTSVEEIKSLRRKVALAPITTTEETAQGGAVLRESSSGSDDEIWEWPAGEKAPDPLEGSGASISDTSGPTTQQEHEGILEKKKKFQLRGIRKKKGGAISPAHGDSGVAAAVEETTHESESMSPTKLRHRKKFGRKKHKAAAAADEDADGPLSENQRDLRRGIKVQRNEHESLLQESDNFTPKKEKVRERIKRRLKKGHRKGLSIDSGEFWEWEQSDSDDAELFSQIGGEIDDSQSGVFNGSDLHATDFENVVPNCGVPLTPIKDGVPLRSRLKSRDKKELRVKPYYCFAPHKVHMTQDEIYQNMVQPSEVVENVESFVEPWYEVKKESVSETERTVWGNTDDGRIGSLKVEVLGCVGLSKHKADAIVYLVCGDAAFATDVIPSSRSPMWPACSKRAACFPVFHAYASLYIGVFDVIARRNSENDTFCGRASLDLAILRPDSEYDVTLPLRGSSFIYDRRPQGVVRLRFSLHWFSERAAVLSYLKAPRNMASTYRLVEQPSIPCADPKTFRNVAVTIHGPELPGKYTKKAFQATMREFTLYWQNFKFMAKSSVRDAVLYEQPLKSLYIFLGWMHCAINSSVRFVPAYVVGFLIILLLEGYVLHAANERRSGGYSPVSIQELLLALLQSSKSRQIRPLLREKKVRKEVSKEENDGGDGDPCDHMEFPFSDRYEYKRRSIEDSLVTRHTSARKEKLEELELQGRLSIYVKSASFGSGKSVEMDGDDTIASSINPGHDIGDSEHGDFDSDPELDVHGDVDNVFELDMDDEEDNQPLLARSSRSLSTSSVKSCIVVGPPQDTDMKPKRKVPPQVHLARLEDKLNKLTQSLSMDRVFSSTLAYRPQPQQEDANFRSVMGAHHVAGGKKKGKRIPLDEFDKRLGYRLRHTNPVTEITSSYLGPLMRIFRILCTLTRVVFNVGVWSDPYLSFWVLCFLILLLLVLIVFPWRLFLFAVGIICFGPQNFLVGRRLARKATEETPEVEEEPTKPTEPTALDNNTEANPKKGTRRSAHKNPIAKLKERRQKRLAEKQESRESGGAAASSFAELEQHNGSHLDNRPAFSAAAKATRKQVQPREIVVPYSRFRKERFYDWPPDPTGSRATPIRFENCKFEPTQLFE